MFKYLHKAIDAQELWQLNTGNKLKASQSCCYAIMEYYPENEAQYLHQVVQVGIVCLP